MSAPICAVSSTWTGRLAQTCLAEWWAAEQRQCEIGEDGQRRRGDLEYGRQGEGQDRQGGEHPPARAIRRPG